MPRSAQCPGTTASGSPLPWRTTWCGSPSPPAASTLNSVPAASSSPAQEKVGKKALRLEQTAAAAWPLALV